MKEFLKFILSKSFLKQVFYILIFLSLVLASVLLWLRFYTNHGQKIEMKNYINQNLEHAAKDAKNASFSIIVSDSTHIVGKPGGIILDQNPMAGSMVKENRKIYVRTTKYNPDQILVKDLPLLYGTDYKQAEMDLKSRSIFSEIKRRQRDPGQPGHILEVWYNNVLIIDKNKIQNKVKIEKGGTLSFVISESKGGMFIIPDLTCKKLSDAKSYMLYSKLNLGNIKGEYADISENELWVVSQYPKAIEEAKLGAGKVIDIVISDKKPSNCN